MSKSGKRRGATRLAVAGVVPLARVGRAAGDDEARAEVERLLLELRIRVGESEELQGRIPVSFRGELCKE